MTGQTVSHYRILEKLGEGGMGVVYKAEDLKLTRIIALKFLPHGLGANEPERARFLQEARAAAILNHPNICTVYDILEHDGQLFIVMEYVEGKTLREIVPMKKIQDAIGYAVQIAEALQEAHSKGIVHRDIKADNIMVNSKNQVKVMDFGLAKLKGSLKLTKTSSTVGTLAYMAPEQIQGGEVDARSDLFSFGIVLYEMLTGHLPFRGEHEAAMVYSIANEEPEPLQHYVPNAPSELLHIIDRALEKDREERYQTVHDMLIDLRRLNKDSYRVSPQQYHDVSSPATSLSPPVQETRIRRKTLWLGAGILVVLCCISVVLFLSRKPQVQLNPNRTTVTLQIPFKEIEWPSLSRDGNWLVFPARDENERWDLYLMNIASGKPSRVTNEPALSIQSVDLSPDASQIVFPYQNGLNKDAMLRLVASQGGRSRTLVDTGLAPVWRRDGQRIGYERDDSGHLTIWSIKPDGTDKRLEFTDTISAPRSPYAMSWSPDGGSIAWVRNYPEGHGEVMVRDLATGMQRQLTSEGKIVDEVVWTENDQILFVSDRSGPHNLWMIPAHGGEATQVTQGGVPILGARISADNRTLVYLQRESLGQIWISGIDGGNACQIPTAEGRIFSASISPDGNQIAYTFADMDYWHPRSHLFVMDRNGKNQRQLTYGSESIGGCEWSPGGDWIAFAHQTPGEFDDSVYIVHPFDPGPPRLLCKSLIFEWVDSQNAAALIGMKTYLVSVNGETSTQPGQDSTFSVHIGSTDQLLILDLRKQREGIWSVLHDSIGKDGAPAKMIAPFDGDWRLSKDLRYLIQRQWDEDSLWRVWTSTGRRERIGKALPGFAVIRNISMDGKEIIWTKREFRSKLVLVRNVFE